MGIIEKADHLTAGKELTKMRCPHPPLLNASVSKIRKGRRRSVTGNRWIHLRILAPISVSHRRSLFDFSYGK